jgi:hypothetical protein
MRIIHEMIQPSTATSVAAPQPQWPIAGYWNYFVSRIQAERDQMRNHGLRSGIHWQAVPEGHLRLFLTAQDEAELEFHALNGDLGDDLRNQVSVQGIRSLNRIFGYLTEWDAGMFMLDVRGGDPP